MDQNQEQAIEFEESPEFQRSLKHLRAVKEDPMEEDESDGGEPHSLTRSNAFVGHMPAKQPYHVWPNQSDEEEDEEDKDLAWFFRKFHPGLHKTNQIAWCRTYANCLAAQIPKNRPKTYKKNKTSKK